MKLREEEFYEQYHHHGGTTIIPTEIFNELYDDATEEIERLKDDNKYLNKVNIELSSEKNRLNSIIKEVREYINKIPTQPVIRVFKKELLEILEGENNDK